MAEDKDEKNDTREVTSGEVEAFLDEEPLEENDYVDPLLVDVKKTRALLQFWQQIQAEVVLVKEGYHLAKKVEDEALKNRYLDQGKPLMKKIKVLEAELKSALPKLRKKEVFSPEELSLLPKWMLKLLGVKYNEDL